MIQGTEGGRMGGQHLQRARHGQERLLPSRQLSSDGEAQP